MKHNMYDSQFIASLAEVVRSFPKKIQNSFLTLGNFKFPAYFVSDLNATSVMEP
jgi:hypothetical protein